MGYTFANIQLRSNGKFDKALTDSIALCMANSQGWKLTDDSNKADVMTVIAASEESPWIAVASEAFDGEPDAVIHAAEGLSESLQTDALAIACFDSDYLFLNLLNPSEGINLWASTGSAAAVGLKGMRRGNYRAWNKRVKNVDAFQAVMKKQYVCAEDCLNELEDILDLPALQSVGGVERVDRTGAYVYFFAADEDIGTDEPPILDLDYSSSGYAPKSDSENELSFVNRGGASRGIAVAFMGEEVERGDVAVYTATIQVQDNQDQLVNYPIEIEETMASDGRKMLYGELPQFLIPRAVNKNLPMVKRFEMERKRRIKLRYIPESMHPYHEGKQMTGLTVHMIPLKNWSGQCGWRGYPLEKEF